jgi:RHS repeat-associated protein
MSAAYALLLASAAVFATGARAQDAPSSAPPLYYSIDSQGVDLATGSFNLTRTDIAIGSGSLGVSYGTANGPYGTTNTADYYFSTAGGTTNVTIGGFADQFPCTSGTCGSVKGSGATLSFQSARAATYSFAGGTTVTFATNQSAVLYPVRLTRPNGVVITFVHDFDEYGTRPSRQCAPVPSRIACEPVGGGQYISSIETERLSGLQANTGYALTLSYQGADPLQVVSYHNPVAATVMNTTVGPASARSVAYSTATAANGTVRTVTDPTGATSTYSYDPQGRLTNIRLPGAQVDAVVVQYGGDGRVSSVATPAGTTTYSWAVSGSQLTATVTDPTGIVRTAVIDLGIGRIVSDTVNGQTTTTTYDSFGRVASVTQPEGNSVSYSYDARGNVLTTTVTAKSGGAQIVTSATYPQACESAVTCNKPLSTTDARGKTTSYSYDAATGLPATVSPPAASQITYGYSDVSAPGGGTIRLPSSITRQINSSGDQVTTTIAYPAGGNPLPASVTTSGPGVSSTVSYSYTAAGDVDTVSGPVVGMATHYYYDAARRVVGVVGPDPDGSGPLRNRALNISYRADGLVSSAAIGTTSNQGDQAGQSFQPLGTTTYDYDAARRLTRVLALGTNYDTAGDVRYSYDAAGRQISQSVIMGANEGPTRNTLHHYRTTDGRMDFVRTSPDNVTEDVVRYSYTPNGQLASLTDPENRTTDFAYDGFDRPQTTTYADGSTEVATYDNGGLVTQVKLRDGQTIGFGYDDAGRRTSRSGAGLSNSYGYDLLGRLVSATGGSYNVARSYDALGNLTADTVAGYAMLNAYDAAGRRTRVAWGIPDIYLQYTLLATGEPAQVADSYGNAYASFAWDDLGRPTSINYWPYYGVPVATSYAYGTDLRLQRLSHSFGSGPGNAQANDVAFGFGYNQAGQIVSRTTSNDAYVVDAPAGDSVATTNNLNQLTPTPPFGYDARGNQVQNTTAPGLQTSFDAQNKLLTAYRDGQPQVSLEYDALDRLTTIQAGAGATKQRLVWNGDQLAGQLDGNGNLTDLYIYRGDERVPIAWRNGPSGQNRALIQDERGSVIALANKASGVERIHLYDEYGNENGVPHLGLFGYAGHVTLPGVGLVHMRARAYDPRVGRFLSPDPIGYAGGVNFYGYVGGDPVNAIDPNGFEPTPAILLSKPETWTATDDNGRTRVTAGIGGGAEQSQNEGSAFAGFSFTTPRYFTLGDSTDWEIAQQTKDCEATGGTFSYPGGCYPGVQQPAPRPVLQSNRGRLNNCGSEASFGTFRQAANAAFADNPYRPFYSIFPFSAIRGSRIHAQFAGTINATGGLYSAEVSYKDGAVVPYGTAGSVRADGVYGPVASPFYVVELKSGFAVPTPSEVENYRRNLPPGTGVCGLVEAPGAG